MPMMDFTNVDSLSNFLLYGPDVSNELASQLAPPGVPPLTASGDININAPATPSGATIAQTGFSLPTPNMAASQARATSANLFNQISTASYGGPLSAAGSLISDITTSSGQLNLPGVVLIGLGILVGIKIIGEFV
jgi:hypothetical protein